MNGYPMKLFIIALLTFVITDAVWLGFIAKNLYVEQYGQWLRLSGGQLKPLWWAAIAVYLLLALSVVVFVVPLAQGSLLYAALYGAMLGAIIYGVYDFTCLAVFKDFPVAIGFIDWVWGIAICSWSSLVTNYFANYLK